MVDGPLPFEEEENGDDDEEDEIEDSMREQGYILGNHVRPIWAWSWNMSPNQPPMPVLASRHYPPPKWPLRRRKSWEILPPPGIFMALRPDQVRFRGLRSPDPWDPWVHGGVGVEFSTDTVQHGPRDPNMREKGHQVQEVARELRRGRGRPRRERNGDDDRV